MYNILDYIRIIFVSVSTEKGVLPGEFKFPQIFPASHKQGLWPRVTLLLAAVRCLWYLPSLQQRNTWAVKGVLPQITQIRGIHLKRSTPPNSPDCGPESPVVWLMAIYETPEVEVLLEVWRRSVSWMVAVRALQQQRWQNRHKVEFPGSGDIRQLPNL